MVSRKPALNGVFIKYESFISKCQKRGISYTWLTWDVILQHFISRFKGYPHKKNIYAPDLFDSYTKSFLNDLFKLSQTCRSLRGITANTLHVFHVETTWKGPFPRCFYVECTWCICRDVFINLPLFGITSFQIGKKIQKLFTEKLFSHSLKTVFTSHIRVKSFFTFKEKLPKMSR